MYKVLQKMMFYDILKKQIDRWSQNESFEESRSIIEQSGS